MALSLYNIRLHNKETDKPLWETYNAIYVNEKWYVDDMSIAVGIVKSNIAVTVEYYGSLHCMYPLNTNKYDILKSDTTVSYVTRIGKVKLVEWEKEE